MIAERPPRDGRDSADETPAIGALLRAAQERLRKADVEAPRIQATTLLGHVLELDRAALLARSGETVDAGHARRFLALVERRARREPLQYLVGRAPFLDFDVRVGAGVFIPRPETEQLVERALEEWDSGTRWAIEVGTGSGAVAIALARARPRSRILAIDLSPIALASAQRSAADNGVEARIAFVRADLLTPCRRPCGSRLPAAADIGLVVSNPPYARDIDVVQPEVVDHEPRLAWRGGERGTEVYERLVPQAAAVLRPGRPLVLEIGYDQATTVPAIIGASGVWGEPRVEPDFQGLPRVLTTRRSGG